MIEARIIDLLEDKLNNIGSEYRLYIVKDSEVCFYVGQSKDVVNRLWEHLGQGERSYFPSTLGFFIKRNFPKSKDFNIVFLRPDEVSKEWDHDVDSAEEDLIQDLNPCFNVTYNMNPKQLPKKYLEPIELDLEVTASDFIPF